MSDAIDSLLDDNLSTRIREETLAVHQDAERSRFVGALFGGELPLDGYAALVAQHHAIYTALEHAVDVNVDPDVAPFLDRALDRLPALARDLDFLGGRVDEQRLRPLPATERYAEHLRSAATTSPVVLLAHHYVRYLGDLSGGQMIRRSVARTYGFDDERGTEFYRFPLIASPKAFKDAYRARLDALDWSPERRDELVAEVEHAYRLNTAVFDDLAAAPAATEPHTADVAG